MSLLNRIFDKGQKTIEKVSVLTRSSAEIIEEIHHSFEIAGDQLLEQANRILAEKEKFSVSKVNLLGELGFTRTKEYVKSQQEQSKREIEENVIKSIMEAKKDFPTHKFITYDKALDICEKYSLVLGLSSSYKGFVPEKNLLDIKKFYDMYEEKCTYYYIHSPLFGSFWRSSDDYQDNVINKGNRFDVPKEAYDKFMKMDKKGGVIISEVVFKTKYPLFMCAPLKDMDTTGKELKGRVLMNIPDPIVLHPYYKNKVKGFIIVTAWGDESKDPEITNHNNN